MSENSSIEGNDIGEKIAAIKKYLEAFDHQNEAKSIHGFVDLLKKINIKMAVFDFDLTLIGKHSGGYIDKLNDIEDIGTSVTNAFKILSKRLYENDIKITVATFSDDETIRYSKGKSPSLIAGEELIQHCIKNSNCETKIERVYAYYPYYYKEPKKYMALGLKEPMSNDKSYHLKRIRNEFSVNINEIIFFDDDVKNCISAQREGYITFNVTGKKGFNFKDIKLMQ
ncbi:conserved Plasmodium protein, unknown function [Plasmodium berghei]|uniref:Rhoptry protein, putative n=2 Tax=Plasmodium berghei TaxID=5821 RepID=A0A509AHA7_PLABA|nr:rhoptry protein, putative [Plasmodium berghei ANKA]CXI19875.1 conserved Plasmodium protein, unknown function [Plasmodium berghei]SCM19886.1 conserved Plasmodium protein, unknown function [Plasmodium berghei]SCN23611.1 conserved Plasmodium protein, unknown function [Plasmodium berghei]SCO59176.1 conserved Plasmodium protein, unknown function [Plasmodium berghei]SCO59981.1 conserved Plasmodium protein, unknown function [Plasmodium berghei]|eukprot:XP_034420689.1 rhoptry protein, putative [Plasmodium berghei ANKA]